MSQSSQSTEHKPGKKGPLTGLRFIEMEALGPVPFSGMMLSDLGAEVLRIERLGSSPPGVPIDPQFDFLSRGRQTIALDLKHPDAIEIVMRLIETADGLLEGMRPGAMERLGLGPEQCLARNPRLIYARMTGWGQTGPLAQRAGHDINYIALNGVLHATGADGGPPIPPINLVGDYGGGSMFLLAGILAAIIESKTSGQGQVVDAAMLEGSSYLMTTVHMFMAAGLWQTERGTNLLDGGAPFYCVYETSDAQYMAVGAIEPKFYAEFVAGLGLDIHQLPSPMNRERWRELKNTFADVFRKQSRAYWTEVFNDRDACVTPVLSVAEAVNHEHNLQRENYLGAFRTPNVAPRFSRTQTQVDPSATERGRGGRSVLQNIGFDDARIDELAASGVIGSA